MTTRIELTAGDEVEFRGRTWTVQMFDNCASHPLTRAHNASIGVAGFAILVHQGKRKRYESLARIGFDGRVLDFV